MLVLPHSFQVLVRTTTHKSADIVLIDLHLAPAAQISLSHNLLNPNNQDLKIDMASRARQLVEILSQSISDIEEFLRTQGSPDLSMEQDVHMSFQAHPKFASPKDTALLACKELSTLLGGSFGAITNQTVKWYPQRGSIIGDNLADK